MLKNCHVPKKLSFELFWAKSKNNSSRCLGYNFFYNAKILLQVLQICSTSSDNPKIKNIAAGTTPPTVATPSRFRPVLAATATSSAALAPPLERFAITATTAAKSHDTVARFPAFPATPPPDMVAVALPPPTNID